jgi:hypothetical protein
MFHEPTPTFLNPITFTVSSPRGTILNSAITGPQSQRYFSVTTDSTKGGFSIVQNFSGEIIAVIKLRKHPVVEIFGTVSTRTSAHWLKLSPSKECAVPFDGKQGIIRAFTDSDSWLFKGAATDGRHMTGISE